MKILCMHKYSKNDNKKQLFKFTFRKVGERGSERVGDESEGVIECDVICIYSKQIIKSIKD